jgi:hypothetical protein
MWKVTGEKNRCQRIWRLFLGNRYTLDGTPRIAKHFSMIAGGTGITPCYQVGTHALPLPIAGNMRQSALKQHSPLWNCYETIALSTKLL